MLEYDWENIYEVLLRYNVFKIFFYVTALLIGECFCRLWDTIDEICKKSNYYPAKDRIRKILEITFYFRGRLYILIIYVTSLLIISQDGFKQFFTNVYDNLPLSITYLIASKLHIHYSLLDQAKWIRSGSGIDYASGMASNFFHGYIRLQLIEKGDGFKGIKERIEDYESSNRVTFATKKLIILIPSSMHTKPKIRSDLLESATSLEQVNMDRAGVRRIFKNDVYRLNMPINGRFYYIALQGATPLLSFYEACRDGVTRTFEMETMKREILFQFYKSIKKFCKTCPETRNVVDFLFYNDCDAQGNDVDIGKVIQKFISENLEATN